MVAESARVLVGDEPDLRVRHEHGCVYLLFAPELGVIRAIHGVDEARALPGVLDLGITRRPGDVLGRWPIACSAPGSPLWPVARGRRPCAAPTRCSRPCSSNSTLFPATTRQPMPEPAAHMNTVGDALSIRYNNLVYELQSAGHDVTVLSLGEAFFDVPLHSFEELPQPAIFHYSHSRGLPELRSKLARYYTNEYGVPVDPEREIIVTAGSKVAIHMTLMAMLDPGDEAVIVEPAWVSYVEQVKLCHAVPVTVPYNVPLNELDQYITPRTKVVILNYPNNPRGQTLSTEEWAGLHEMARRHDVYLLCDEAYSDFVPEAGALHLGRRRRPEEAPHRHLQLDVEELRPVRLAPRLRDRRRAADGPGAQDQPAPRDVPGHDPELLPDRPLRRPARGHQAADRRRRRAGARR